MTYFYDVGGNIYEKNIYNYTTGTLGTPIDTITYDYDTTWDDKLLSYDGRNKTGDGSLSCLETAF